MTTFDLLILGGGALLLIGSIVCAWIGWHGENRLLAIQATPTSSAIQVQDRCRQLGGAAFGQPCEMVGVVESDEVLSSPLSGQICVAYCYSRTDEDWARPQVRMGRRDTNMNGMVLVNSFADRDERHVKSFWVRDTTGRVRVEPAQAQFDLKETDRRYDEMLSAIGNSERRTWHVEQALPLGHPVYVLGSLVNRDGEPVIAAHPLDRNRKFLISHRSEQQLTSAARGRSYSLYFLAGVSGGLAVLLLLWRLL